MDPLSPSGLANWMDEATRLAQAAGHEIMSVYVSDFAVQHKEDRTPLTAADLAAHHLIDAGLAALSPSLPILSEESSQLPFSERQRWPRYWLIDPLDGTREFIKRNGEFTVNIALIDGHDAVLGVVHAPALDITYVAARGQGAYKINAQGQRSRIQVRKLPQVPTVAGSRSHGSPAMASFLEKLGPHELISMGSALKSCLVAEGAADIYPRLGPTSEWDTAAAQCVVEEAGGCVTDLSLQRLRYNTKDSVLNPSFLVFGDSGHDWGRYL